MANLQDINQIIRDNAKKLTWVRKLWDMVEGLSFLIIKITGKIPSQIIRKFLYRFLFGIRMGKDVVIYGGVEIRNPRQLKIGENSIIGHRSILDARRGLTIGKNVNLSTGVWIWTLEHDYQDPHFGTKGGEVLIKLKFPAFSWTPSGCGEIYIINKNRLLIKKLQIHNLLILL